MQHRKTGRIVVLVCIALATTAIVVGWLVLSAQRVTEDQFDQLTKGMTEGEVEELLHGPGTTVEEWMGQKDVALVDEHGLTGMKYWRASGRTIVVEFVDGRATHVVFAEAPLGERLRAWRRGDAPLHVLDRVGDPESPVRVRMIDFRKKA